MEGIKLTKFEFKILQNLANMVWIKNHIREKCEDVNQEYLLKKLSDEDFDPEPFHLVNQFDFNNAFLLLSLIKEIKHEKTKNNLIKFYNFCIPLEMDKRIEKIHKEFKEYFYMINK